MTNVNITLTELEKAVLLAINESDYGNEFGDTVWTWSVLDACRTPIKNRQFSGIVSSLSQKGLVESVEDGKDSSIWLTDSGKQACIDNNLLGQFYSKPKSWCSW